MNLFGFSGQCSVEFPKLYKIRYVKGDSVIGVLTEHLQTGVDFSPA